jgi:hypothetical protein
LTFAKPGYFFSLKTEHRQLTTSSSCATIPPLKYSVVPLRSAF